MSLSTESALMEPPPPSYLDGLFPAGGIDWTKFSGGTLSMHKFDMAAFAHAWAPLERHWEGGRAPSMHSSAYMASYLYRTQATECWTPLADFSRMQPNQPDPWVILLGMVFMKMVSAAGAKEAELQGASSVMRGNAITEALTGET
jgi:hypothetical protein